MFKKLFIPVLLFAALTVQAQTKKPAPAKKPVTSKPAAAAPAKPLQNAADSLSYAMGISVGGYLKSLGVKNINYVLLNKAIDQTLKESKTYLNLDEANSVMEQSARAGANKVVTAEKEKGRQFLLQNKKKPGVLETASGLQYEVLKAGTGPKPTAQDSVVVHYAGKLLSGKEFDSSYARNQPVTLTVTGVIRGWTEALQLMPHGSKWRLFIPSALAYGDRGAGADIPGGATLVFDVELLEIPSQKVK